MPKSISLLEARGFLDQLPAKANIDDYEVITVKGKSGENLKMYRRKKEQIEKRELENFNKSWDTFQQHLS
tara:strand:- start:8027 stop:8236 length:210 start_codon:yes stop_codon:yes gene_type:complete